MLVSVPIFVRALCIFAIVLIGVSAHQQDSCPREEPLTEMSQKFLLRFSLIHSDQEFAAVCAATTDTSEYRLFDPTINNICRLKSPGVEPLVSLIIGTNNLPRDVCDDQKYGEYRFTLTNKLMKPDGKVANRFKHRACYSAIFKSEQYKKLLGGATNPQAVRTLDSVMVKLQKIEGNRAASCALGRFKSSFMKIIKSAKTELFSGYALVGAAFVVAILAGVGLSVVSMGGSIAIVAGLIVVGVFLASNGENRIHDKFRKEQYSYMNDISKNV